MSIEMTEVKPEDEMETLQKEITETLKKFKVESNIPVTDLYWDKMNRLKLLKSNERDKRRYK